MDYDVAENSVILADSVQNSVQKTDWYRGYDSLYSDFVAKLTETP